MRKRRVLIAEDDQDTLDMVCFILQRAGYETLQAADGLEVLEVAQRELPDLILLDMTMPAMDGWTAAEKLKGNPATKDILVVALTVRSLPQDKMRALEAGCDGYLTKPMNVKNFIKQVTSFLEGLE
jgi:CheY-like chemotaxis protein